MDDRAVVGAAERCQDATFSEAEEMAFKLKVAAVVRENPKARRFAAKPHPRFCPTPPPCLPEWDANLHKHAMYWAGVQFSLESLRDKDAADRWFVPAMTYVAVTRMSEMVASSKSCHGG